MSYDAAKDDFIYDDNLSLEENHENRGARAMYLYEWARENWGTSCHAGGAEARAQYLESCGDYDEESLSSVDENDGWDYVKGHLEDYAMPEILNDMIEDGSIYTPEEKCGYGKNGFGWMLDAVGYDTNGCMSYIKEWLDKNTWYEGTDKVKEIITKDYYDMWEDEDE